MNFGKWLSGANASLYSCHLLASWSSRMWAFSMGVFLITMSPKSLQLSATYGLSMGAAILVFGAVIGDWVDKTSRLKAATVSMIFQNILIATCACVILTLILLLSEVGEVADWLRYLFYVIIICLNVCSRLVKEARIIVMERDWIVEMCAKDEHHLAVLTSSIQRLDLLTKILAPIVTGQILTFAGLNIGCGFIAVWSLISMVLEYYLIRRIYNIVPALKAAKCKVEFVVAQDYRVQDCSDEVKFLETDGKGKPTVQCAEVEYERTACKDKSNRSCHLWQFLASFLILYRGMKTYIGSVTKWPGLALACLYLTVLTMGPLTVGYGTMQGLSGSILGIMTGVGAGFGIFATVTYPFIVKKLGLPVTGVLALGLQVAALTLCVVSVWLPGSPFDLFSNHKVQETNGTLRNCTTDVRNGTQQDIDVSTIGVEMLDRAINITSCNDEGPQLGQGSSLSVWVLIAGIVLARFGLWTAHMTIVQLFLENVASTERGIVNGFQSSLNQLMNFLKYALVVILPYPHQFGLLVLISYTFICIAWMLMGVNAVTTARRKKLLDLPHRNKSDRIWRGVELLKQKTVQ